MEENKFSGSGWDLEEWIKVIEEGDEKKVLINGRLYMSWNLDDEASQRIAIVQIYKLGMSSQEDIAKAFGVHVNSVYNYIQFFTAEGTCGLISRRRGPKGSSKVNPRLRSKILVIFLKEGILEYGAIQKKLEGWNEQASLASIRQVLMENGIIDEKVGNLNDNIEQSDLFDKEDEGQLLLNLDYQKKKENDKVVSKEIKSVEETDRDNESSGFYSSSKINPRRYYSQAQRMYLDQSERGDYNTYAGGLLFVPLLRRYSFLPTIKKIIDIETYEGYTLEELCLTLFYFDTFNYQSMEDFKKAYPEEFGTLIGRSLSPSLFTLRRFLHRVKEKEVSEKLIDEFSLLYLKKGLAKWGVLFIDGHFLPYYGLYTISMGFHGVRKIPMKGSYNFLGADEKYNPWIFLVRSSREDLLRKVPEMIENAKRIGRKAGVSEDDIENLIVVFDREGYSAALFWYLDGRDMDKRKRRAIFITWAKYTEKWVYDVAADKFDNELTLTYKIRESKKVRYFETERTMKNYGKIWTIVVERKTDKRRCAIYTNAVKEETETELLVELLCHRWGEENLIKELMYKHLINYWPGHEIEDMEEQPLVDNPKLKELKQQRTNLKTELSGLKSKFGNEVLDEMEKDADWEQIKEKRILTLADIEKIRSQLTLLSQGIDNLPEKIRFDEAHDGKKLFDLNYERKRFLDCIKIFSYNVKNQMCRMLLNHYDNKKEILPALSMIIERTGYVKLENGKLRVQLRAFRNVDIDYAARRLCEDLNKMRPVTLDKYRFPIHYEVL
ncbi:MAG: helix-turn-helix domain-containing protein [Candidatus Omnitrophica bacterium]|nr:helix-turn-helix domain-containing protein [Candidatus Omnitrophota bacterium]